VSDAFFAVDVGGSSVKSALVVDGAVESVAREPIAPGLDGLLAQLAALHPGTPAWGLCLPGQVSDGRVRGAVNLGLDDEPLVELLAAELAPPTVFANDLVAATTGEAAGGTMALLQIGTGIAGRFAVDGVVVPSATGLAGEVGHLTFRPNGRVCTCGRNGCVEAYGGWSGIAARCEELGHAASAEEVLEAGWAEEIRADALEAIGFAAAALVTAHDPGTLRLGGGVAAVWGEVLLGEVRAAVRRRVLPAVAEATAIEPTRLGDSAPLLGLALLARSAR
jgi:glucokinase